MTELVDSKNLDKAAKCLKEGGLVAIPTETVYGLAANIFDSKAVRGIFEAKGRPSDNPLIVHIWSIEQLDDLVEEVPVEAKVLMEKFWPGPISFVLKAKDSVPRSVTGGLNTVAVRMPSHPVCLDILKKANVLVAAPSANSSGRPSPTKASHVMFDLDGKIDFVVDGGKCSVGVESTVLDCTKYPFTVLRPGAVTVDDLSELVAVSTKFESGEEAKSPGMRYKHYTPAAKVYLVDDVNLYLSRFSGKKVAYIGLDDATGVDFKYIVKDLSEYSQFLFSRFRGFDHKGADVILAQVVPEKGLGLALMNRLKKAGEILE